MATDNKSTKSKKGKQRYLPYNKAVKKKGAYPLHPGVEGFFITCDGGRERQASQEAINVIDSFYEELVSGKDLGLNLFEAPSKPSNKKIVFSYSDSSSSEGDDDDDEKKQEGDEKKQEAEDKKQGGEDKEAEEEGEVGEESKGDSRSDGASHNNATSEKSEHQKKNDTCGENKTGENTDDKKGDNLSKEICANEAEEPPAKKQCLGTDSSECTIPYKVEDKSIDKLIEAELQELGDKNKGMVSYADVGLFYRDAFFTLESGCNGVVFVQMRKREGDPSPNAIVQHMMTSAAATKKHMSRFILRVLPVEVACYSSEEEISRAIKPLLEQHFPVETQNPQKFAVLYEARANTGIDRMKIINAVAKSVPAPHKVDLSNPDKTIVVEICRTICLIGVVDKYKQLAKYNLRQLTSSKP